MRLDNDLESFNLLITTIHDYYKTHGSRYMATFHFQEPGDNGYCIRFLLERKHVIECGVLYEPRVKRYLSTLLLGIGPEYFGPANFWSYEQSERFTMEATTEGIVHNLGLLDEFLGYKR